MEIENFLLLMAGCEGEHGRRQGVGEDWISTLARRRWEPPVKMARLGISLPMKVGAGGLRGKHVSEAFSCR